MKMSLYEILLVMMNLDCAKCPSYNPEIKDNAIKEALKQIENALVRDVLPPILNHKFDEKCAKIEVMAHTGGFNNSRALSIRRIRKFCQSPEKKEDKNLIEIT